MKTFHIVVRWRWWIGGFRGLALAPFVFVKDPSDRALMAHELTHIRQQYRHWIIGFWLRYLWQLATVGYWAIDYEREARREALRAAGEGTEGRLD